MKVNGVNGSGYTQQLSKNKTHTKHEFESSFAGSLLESSTGIKDDTRNNTEEIKKEHDIRYAAMANGINNMCGAGSLEKNSITPCEVKNISYKESDNVKVCIEGGYVLKAKLYEDKNTIYIEKKNENGTVEAFEVDINSIDKDSDEPIAKMALDTYNKSGEEKNATLEDDFIEALIKFKEYVEERIENGPPKFQIGSMSISIEDWDKMLEKVDEAIDEMKEELRERVEKQEEAKENETSKENLIRKLIEDGGV